MIEIYTDGSSIGNGTSGQQAGAASSIYINDTPVVFIGKYLSNSTNNQAELFAVLQIVYWLYKNVEQIEQTNKVINMYIDSKYTIGILSEEYKNINKNVKLVEKIRLFINKLKDKEFTFKYNHIRSHTKLTTKHHIRNDEVDKLAKHCARTTNDVFSRCKYPL